MHSFNGQTYKLVLTNKKIMEAEAANPGKVMGTKLTRNEINQINKVIECRDVDYETAKKEVAGYFRRKGEAYASDASTRSAA